MAKNSDNRTEYNFLNLNEPPTECCACYVMLEKDKKPICRTKCISPPFELSPLWTISEVPSATKFSLSGLPQFFLYSTPQNMSQKNEWGVFLKFLQEHNRVAIVNTSGCDFYILSPSDGDHAVISYRVRNSQTACVKSEQGMAVAACSTSDVCHNDTSKLIGEGFPQRSNMNDARRNLLPKGSNTFDQKFNPSKWKPSQIVGHPSALEAGEQASCKSHCPIGKEDALPKSFVRSDPSYLKTLGEAHAGWIFGAIAELVDNSRDAKATRLKIFIDHLYSKKAGNIVPVLSFIDDGIGMSHLGIVRMLTFGHKQPEGVDRDRIGRFGIGFKTGVMRLGRDAFVLTQTLNSRSIAFLSQSFNEDKANIEIPIVSYRREGSFMEVDSSIHSEAEADSNLNDIKEFSPFNEYVIGEKSGLFGERGTGTQIYLWNLDKWGSGYSLEWKTANRNQGSSQDCQGDILIRSRRIRSRPGQICQKVPLDYSLQAYLEVIFLDPRMKICVQGSLVNSRPLAKSLNKTSVVNDTIMGKAVQLTLGRSQLEWERVNCGMFLYWHGRLIEAYKRVGGMVHSADMGRGVIGVIDVTDIMMDDNNMVKVLSNKQGFQDCEEYAKLEEWLGNRSDEYWDANFDTLDLRKGNARYKPDHEWVQCDKCRKWRILSGGFDSKSLPPMWFCCMSPFNGSCNIPEQQAARGVITVDAKRSGCDPKSKLIKCAEKERGVIEEKEWKVIDNTIAGDSGDDSSQTVEEEILKPVLKRLRRGPSRTCKPQRS